MRPVSSSGLLDPALAGIAQPPPPTGEHSGPDSHQPTAIGGASDSLAPPTGGESVGISPTPLGSTKTKRARRTKAQMEEDRRSALTKKRTKPNTKTKGNGPDSEVKDVDRSPNFTVEDYEHICDYIETPEHFSALFGDGKKTLVAGSIMTKAAAFAILAAHVNTMSSSPHMSLSGRQMQQRFASFKRRYQGAKSFANGTGAGITAADAENGVVDMGQKLHEICPCFDRMDVMFGEKANVTAMAEYDTTAGDVDSSDTEAYNGWHPSGDESNVLGAGDDLQLNDDAHVGVESPAPSGIPIVPHTLGPKDPSPGCTPSSSQRPSIGPSRARPKVIKMAPLPEIKSEDIKPRESKLSIAQAYERSNTARFGILEGALQWQKEKYEREQKREDELMAKKAAQESAQAKDAQESQKTRLSMRIEQTKAWLAEGRSLDDIERLFKMIDG